MSSTLQLSSVFSSHVEPRLAAFLAKSVTYLRPSRCGIYGGRSLSHEFRSFCGLVSSPSWLGIDELRSRLVPRKCRPAALGRSFSASASTGADPILSPSSSNLDFSRSAEKDVVSFKTPFVAPTAAYVHIPFCRRRCFYCDFTIVAVGERTNETRDHQDMTMMNYIDLVCKEIASTARERRRRNRNCPPLETVFFGGGTPSLLPVPLLARIIKELKVHYQISENAEIAMEMDPGTFDRAKLEGFLECGISRASLGVQSFQNDLLKASGRSHDLQQVHDAVDAIHALGLRNWSLDLIASLPNQTLENWEHSLQQAISAGPAHLSVYDLQIEEGTLFNRWYKAGESPLPNDETSAEFYRAASLRLREAGYEHYEVSNYAKPGFQCRHNLVYWENRPYFAFGLGSTSYVEGRRFTRPKKMREYKNYVENLDASSEEVLSFVSSMEDRVLDTIMLSLRLARGLNLQEFEAEFGSSITSSVCCKLLEFIHIGLVDALDSDRKVIPADKLMGFHGEKDGMGGNYGDRGRKDRLEACTVEKLIIDSPLKCKDTQETRPVYVRLTDPEGFLVSNEVISSIFSALPSGGF